MSIVNVKKELVASTLAYTNTLIEKCGSRIPGTQGSLSAAHALAEGMRLFCDRAQEEPFSMHPGSLFQIGRIVSLTYLVAFVFLVLGGSFVYPAAVICLLACSYALIHYFLYGSFFDFLFQKKPGCNAVGVLEPCGEVKRQVVVSGHHDSPYVFSFLERFPRLAGIRFFLAMVFFLLIASVSIVASVVSIFQSTGWRLHGLLLILALIGFILIVPLFFFVSTKPSPGAGDNLNGSSIAFHLGRFFADRKAQGDALKHTRLILLSTDGEEAGQRGAIAYVWRHREELLRVPTVVLNFDSIYTLKDLLILTKDRHGALPLSGDLAETCRKIAAEAGYRVKTGSIPFGSGTDAAAFAKEGVEAVGIIGLPTSLFEKERVYHTTKDTIDQIDPEAVEAVFDIAVNYILRADQPEVSG